MRGLAFAFYMAAAAGCTGGVLDDSVGGAPAAASDEITTTNKLSLNKLSLNKLSLNALSAGALASGAGDLAAGEDGRELLVYVARCALPEGDELLVDGERYPGLIGLAPEWRDGACLEDCQRWVSACLLAHVNAKGVEVPISLRGIDRALAVVSAAEAEAYPVEEAGFYGNVFLGDGGPLEMYACLGRGLAGAGETSAYLDDRLCASSDACGFTRTGICAPGACWEDAGPHLGYTGCTRAAEGADLAGLEGLPNVIDLWFQVVTVYLKRS